MIRHVTRPCLCMTASIIIKIKRVISMWTPHWITFSCRGVEGKHAWSACEHLIGSQLVVMVLRAQWPLGTIAQFFHFVAEEKNKQKKNTGILWLGYHRYPSNYKRLEKKQTINSWKRHALCDAVLRYESNSWKFIVSGTKYGRFTTINISKYEHFTR